VNFSAEGLSNDLVSYLSVVFDPNAGHLHKMLAREVPDFTTRVANAEKELKKHLADNHITIIDLFHRIAIRYNIKIVVTKSEIRLYMSVCRNSFVVPRPKKNYYILFNKCINKDHDNLPYNLGIIDKCYYKRLLKNKGIK